MLVYVPMNSATLAILTAYGTTIDEAVKNIIDSASSPSSSPSSTPAFLPFPAPPVVTRSTIISAKIDNTAAPKSWNGIFEELVIKKAPMLPNNATTVIKSLRKRGEHIPHSFHPIGNTHYFTRGKDAKNAWDEISILAKITGATVEVQFSDYQGNNVKVLS